MSGRMDYPDWIISDTHFMHANISTFAGRLTPSFPTPADIDQLMIDNWTELVKPEDTILHLGDFGWFDADEDYPWVRELPGKKLIVRGNHDRRLSADWFDRHDIKEIDAPTYDFEGFQLICTHYPQDVLERDEINIHGHVHNNSTHSLTRSHRNVCVELFHFAPVHFRWIAEKSIHTATGHWNDFGPRDVRKPS